MSCSAASRPFPSASPKLRSPYPAYHSSFLFRFVCTAAGLPAARPCFARIAWARPPAFAPARFARLIARASQAQGARLPSVPLGLFSRRREAGDGAASGCRFLLSHPTTDILRSSPFRRFISYQANKPLSPAEDTGTSHEMSYFVIRPPAQGACLPSISGMAPGFLRSSESKRRPRKPPLLSSQFTTLFPMSRFPAAE